MALYTTLPVYHDCYNLTLMLFRYTKEFPREYKYTLGQDIKHDSIELVRDFIPSRCIREQSRVHFFY